MKLEQLMPHAKHDIHLSPCSVLLSITFFIFLLALAVPVGVGAAVVAAAVVAAALVVSSSCAVVGVEI